MKGWFRYFEHSVLAIAICLLPGMVRANDTCFMQGADGQAIDLSKLCGSSPPPTLPKAPVRQGFYQIPIKRRIGNIPTIEVILNGKQPVEMLFDTGASAIVLNQAIAEKVGVVYGGEQVIVHTAGGMMPSPIGYLRSLKVGPLFIKNVEVVVTPELGTLAGLLGQPFFAGFDITIKQNMIELQTR